MTNQEAINYLLNPLSLPHDMDIKDKLKWHEDAVNMAIEALKAQELKNSTDTISRTAAIAEFSCCELTPDGGIDANYAIDFLMNMPSVQRWIPCSERLPKYGKPVLWCNANGSVFVSAITAMTEHSWAVGKKHRASATIAWMPLPEPYKGD